MSGTRTRSPSATDTYIRESNPTQTQLENALAALENGEAALAFASGMAAGITVVQSLPPGSHVILPDDAYYSYRHAFEDYFSKWGFSVSDRGYVRHQQRASGDHAEDETDLDGDAVESATEDRGYHCRVRDRA